MMILELVLLAAVLVSAAGILFARRIQSAVAMYLIFSVLLAVIWGVRYGLQLAVTEIGVGAVVTGLLLYFSMRKLREEKGARDGAEKNG